MIYVKKKLIVAFSHQATYRSLQAQNLLKSVTAACPHFLLPSNANTHANDKPADYFHHRIKCQQLFNSVHAFWDDSNIQVYSVQFNACMCSERELRWCSPSKPLVFQTNKMCPLTITVRQRLQTTESYHHSTIQTNLLPTQESYIHHLGTSLKNTTDNVYISLLTISASKI